jgi:hypothetical protein
MTATGRRAAALNALAVGLGVAAALTKETAIIVLVGWALARRTRGPVVMAAGAIAVAGAWAVWLRVTLPRGASGDVNELGLPFVGLVQAIQKHWLEGTHRLGMASTIAAIAVGALALWRRGVHHPLGPIVALNLAFLSVMNHNVIGIDFGATRSTFPLLMTALIALATPRLHARRVENDAPVHDDAGIDGPAVASGAPSKW